MTTYKDFDSFVFSDITKLQDKYGSLYAFGEKQFKEKCKKNTVYISDGCGLYIRKENYKEFKKELKKCLSKKEQEHFNMFGLERIVRYKYFNHETQNTGDTEAVFYSVENYQKYTGFNKEDFKKEVYEICNKCFEEAF